MKKETWKFVSGLGRDYIVSDLGKIASLKNGLHIMKPFWVGRRGNKYLSIELHHRGVSRRIKVHRLVIETFLGVVKGRVVDHINGITKDNRLSNLGYCTYRENATFDNVKRKKPKTSQFPGVSWCSIYRKWVTRTKSNGKHIHIGYFKDEKIAALAYQSKIKQLSK